jgi:hypothetical protein
MFIDINITPMLALFMLVLRKLRLQRKIMSQSVQFQETLQFTELIPEDTFDSSDFQTADISKKTNNRPGIRQIRSQPKGNLRRPLERK